MDDLLRDSGDAIAMPMEEGEVKKPADQLPEAKTKMASQEMALLLLRQLDPSWVKTQRPETPKATEIHTCRLLLHNSDVRVLRGWEHGFSKIYTDLCIGYTIIWASYTPKSFDLIVQGASAFDVVSDQSRYLVTPSIERDYLRGKITNDTYADSLSALAYVKELCQTSPKAVNACNVGTRSLVDLYFAATLQCATHLAFLVLQSQQDARRSPSSGVLVLTLSPRGEYTTTPAASQPPPPRSRQGNIHPDRMKLVQFRV